MAKKNTREISDKELKEIIERNQLQKIALEKLLKELESENGRYSNKVNKKGKSV